MTEKFTFWFWLLRLFLWVGNYQLSVAIWLVNRIQKKIAIRHKIGKTVLKEFTVADVVNLYSHGY